VKSDEASLARLMAMAQRGDKQAYGVLLTECQRWLRSYFARRIAPNHLDDLVQETLMALHHKLASYDPARAFLPWLAAIARYRWVDHLRRVYRADETELDEHLAGENEEPAIAARISLERLFAHLPNAQAQAIDLVKIEGLSIAEASRACGQSESLIKVNIHRGLKKLTAMIEKA
jgi:RNA polymerase sigma factor (sigma-70 family)